MSDHKAYSEAVREYDLARDKLAEIWRLTAEVARNLEPSNRYEFAKRQQGALLVSSRYGEAKYAEWPSQAELLEALKRFLESVEKANAILSRIPQDERAGLKPINPKADF